MGSSARVLVAKVAVMLKALAISRGAGFPRLGQPRGLAKPSSRPPCDGVSNDRAPSAPDVGAPVALGHDPAWIEVAARFRASLALPYGPLSTNLADAPQIAFGLHRSRKRTYTALRTPVNPALCPLFIPLHSGVHWPVNGPPRPLRGPAYTLAPTCDVKSGPTESTRG